MQDCTRAASWSTHSIRPCLKTKSRQRNARPCTCVQGCQSGPHLRRSCTGSMSKSMRCHRLCRIVGCRLTRIHRVRSSHPRQSRSVPRRRIRVPGGRPLAEAGTLLEHDGVERIPHLCDMTGGRKRVDVQRMAICAAPTRAVQRPAMQNDIFVLQLLAKHRGEFFRQKAGALSLHNKAQWFR